MEKSLGINILSFCNLAAFIAVVTVNALANILPLNGVGTGELSDLYPNLFVPAGLTFSIWGVIYLLLACFSIYGITAIFKESIDTSFLATINIWFVISSIANIGWIFAWHWRKTFLSLIFMAVILASLIIIYLKLNGVAATGKYASFFVRLPFSVYLGWITVATIANITAVLVNLNWNGFGVPEPVWTVIVIAAAVVITVIIIFMRKDLGYSLVVVWAFVGIIIKRSAAGDGQAVVISASLAIAIISAAYILKLIKS